MCSLSNSNNKREQTLGSRSRGVCHPSLHLFNSAKDSYNDFLATPLLVSFPRARLACARNPEFDARAGQKRSGFFARQPRARMTSKESAKTKASL